MDLFNEFSSVPVPLRYVVMIVLLFLFVETLNIRWRKLSDFLVQKISLIIRTIDSGNVM